MNGFRKGQKISWKHGRGTAHGQVAEKFVRRVQRTIGGAKVVRNGTKEDPAYLVETDGGKQALKLGSELDKADDGEDGGGQKKGGKMDQLFTKIAAKISSWAGQPAAFVVAFLFIIVWGASGPLFGFSDTWQLVVNTSTTIITFLMVFLIQNAQNRDAAAMQAKLDEVIRAIEGARNDFIGIEHLTETELEKIRKQIEDECSEDGPPKNASDSVGNLIKRL